jgi:hypothetical protein
VKRFLVFIIILFAGISLYSQNYFYYPIHALGGLRIGGNTKVRVDSLSSDGTDIKFYNTNDTLNPYIPYANRISFSDALHQQTGVFNVLDYGAVADSATDCTSAFRLTSAAAGVYGVVFIPSGAYIITDSVRFLGSVEGTAARIYTSVTNKTFFVIGQYGVVTYAQSYNMPKMFQRTHSDGTWGTDVAIKVVNTIDCYFNIPRIELFSKGIQFIGNGTGNVYNQIFLGRVYGCKIGIELYPKNNGWVNDNEFYGGRICDYTAQGTNISGSYAINMLDGLYAPDGNIFHKVGLEGDTWQYNVVIRGNANIFDYCRFESTPPHVYIGKWNSGGAFSAYNEFNGSYGQDLEFTYDHVWNLSMTKITGPKLEALSHYATYPVLNTSNLQGSQYPSIAVWAGGWDLNPSNTTWRFQVGGDTLRTKDENDTQSVFTLFTPDGKMSWGTGTAKTDVSLERDKTAILKVTSAILLVPTASPPSSATEGTIYMDTDHHLYVHNGSIWVQLDN